MKRIFRQLSSFSSSISKGQREFYEKNGYLVIEKAIPHEQIDKLVERTNQLVEEADIIKDQIYFSADNKSTRGVSFIDTASSIGYLLEEGVLDEQLKLKTSTKKMALNKIGHAMHDIDPVYKKFSYNPVFQSLLNGLGYERPLLAQSMLIFKNQTTGTKVDMHTDNTYIISRPSLSCMGIWCALEDAKRHNGCMYAFPGSHKVQTNYHLVLDKTRRATQYIGQNPNYEQNYKIEDAACLEVPKGSLIALHGDLVHYSGHNHSAESRHAYTMHFVDIARGNRWSEENWLQRTKELPFQEYSKVVSTQW